VLKSLQNIAKEEGLKKKSNVSNDYDSVDDYPNNVKLPAQPTSPLLKLRIRNTTKYLNWRLSILKRDNSPVRYVILALRKTKAYD
jgi:hypothetical protein